MRGSAHQPRPLVGRDAVDQREQHLRGAVALGGEGGERGQRAGLVVGEPGRERGLEARVVLAGDRLGRGRAGEGEERREDARSHRMAASIHRRGGRLELRIAAR